MKNIFKNIVFLLAMTIAMNYSSGLKAQMDYPEGWVIPALFDHSIKFNTESFVSSLIGETEDSENVICSDGAYDSDNNLLFYIKGIDGYTQGGSPKPNVFDQNGNPIGNFLHDPSDGIIDVFIIESNGVYHIIHLVDPVGKDYEKYYIYDTEVHINNGDFTLYSAVEIDKHSYTNLDYIKDYQTGEVKIYYARDESYYYFNILGENVSNPIYLDYFGEDIDKARRLKVLKKSDGNIAIMMKYVIWDNGVIQDYRVLYSDFISGQNPTHQVNILPESISDFEFKSREEPERFYVSIENTKQIAEYDFSSNSFVNIFNTQNTYGNTEIEIALDGNFYFVNGEPTYIDAGKYFAIIDAQTGLLSENQMIFPNYPTLSVNSYVNSIFHLPNHSKRTSRMEFSSLINPECDGGNGTLCFELINVVWPIEYTVKDQNGTIYTTGIATYSGDNILCIDDLPEGEYEVSIIDDIGIPAIYNEGELIALDYHFDYPEYFDLSDDPDWDNQTIDFKEGFTLLSGTNITISNARLEFDEGASIFIEPGAQLYLNNTELTNYNCNADKMWDGVDVGGNKDLPQTFDNQGSILLTNGSKICNASTAIMLWEPNNWSSAGGIVIANNATFENNKRDVAFMSYHDGYNDNMGSFVNCNFTRDYTYIGDKNEAEAHVTMWQVKGVDFRDCIFTDQIDQFPNALGLFSTNAGFKVTATAEELSHFEGFYRAIDAINSDPIIAPITIEGTTFRNNGTGINLKNIIGLATIIYNDFIFLNYPHKDGIVCDESYARGIYLEGTLGFAVENNTFRKEVTSEDGNFVGIIAHETNSPGDVIYNNTFSDMKFASRAEEDNKGTRDVGLAFECNQNTNNRNDFVFTSETFDYKAQEDTHFGFNGLGAGNTFSANPDLHVYYRGTQYIDYHHINSNTPTLIYDKNDRFILDLETVSNSCLINFESPFGGGGDDSRGIVLSDDERQAEEVNYTNAQAQYESLNAIWNTLMDGGDTEALQQEVESAWPNETWALRAKLLQESPMLSKEVLKKAADKTEVLPEAILFEILAANPEELRKEELLQYLEAKANPLPDYMIDMLREIATGQSYKSVLYGQITNSKKDARKSAMSIVRSIINDSIFEIQDYRIWLANIQTLSTDKSLIASYLQEGDYTTTQNLLDILPQLYELKGDDLTEYTAYKALLLQDIQWKQEGKSLMQLVESDSIYLEDITLTATGDAKLMAENMLTAAFGKEYCNCIEDLEGGTLYSFGSDFGNTSNSMEESDWFTISPNPATIWLSFNCKPDSESNTYVTITNEIGKQIQTFQLQGKLGQKVWNISNLSSGTYFYEAKSGDKVKKGKFIIQ